MKRESSTKTKKTSTKTPIKKRVNNASKKKNEQITREDMFKIKLEIQGKMVFNIIMISILFIGSIFMFIMAASINFQSHKLLITYVEESNVKYNVSLRPNAFYSTKTLDMNQQYPALAIDKINIEYEYKFNASQKGDYRYRYFTTATLVATNKSNIVGDSDVIFTKPYQLENQITGSQTESDSYYLKKDYAIDYATYNNFINSYKNSYGLSVDAMLKVSMYVEVIDNYNGTIINTSKKMDVNIPLISNPVKITINNPANESKSIYDENASTGVSAFFIIFALIMLVSSILLFIQEIRKVLKSERAQSRYINKLNKIISANADVIVKVKNKIDLKDHKIIEVESINALLDAQNELRIPIAYFETKSNREGYFVIINGKEVWRYVFKVEEDK